jgi:hypothetical protein
MARILEYTNTRKAIIHNVKPPNKKRLCEFDTVKLDCHCKCMFINIAGLKKLIGKSEKPVAMELAEKLGMDIYRKITRVELDIVRELDIFFKPSGVRTIFQHVVKNDATNNMKYRTDYYLPDYNLVKGADENNYKDRIPTREKEREKYLENKLKCHFIRCNPDDPKFSITKLLGGNN